MIVQDIYLGDDPSKIYLERDGKLFIVHASPFRAITESDLTEIGTSIPLGAYKQAQHLFRPSHSSPVTPKTTVWKSESDSARHFQHASIFASRKFNHR